MKTFRPLILAATLAAGLSTTLSAQALPNYTALDLGTLGGAYSYATGVNASGQVVGYSSTNDKGAYRAFLTDANGANMRDLGTLGGTYSHAYGVNATGQVVGWANTADKFTHAFLTDANGANMQDLGTLAGGTLPGGTASYAHGVNATGQVVGYGLINANSIAHAFLTDGNGANMRDIGTLAGAVYGTSSAFGVNTSGQVVGASYISGARHAFLTDANGANMRDLGTLGGTESFAYGINATGQVVGYADTGSARHAFLTDANGTDMTDLNSLVTLGGGIFLREAQGINDLGQIVANGSNGHAYLLTLAPVPEPETYALLLAGLGLVSVIARRRKLC